MFAQVTVEKNHGSLQTLAWRMFYFTERVPQTSFLYFFNTSVRDVLWSNWNHSIGFPAWLVNQNLLFLKFKAVRQSILLKKIHNGHRNIISKLISRTNGLCLNLLAHARDSDKGSLRTLFSVLHLKNAALSCRLKWGFIYLVFYPFRAKDCLGDLEVYS